MNGCCSMHHVAAFTRRFQFSWQVFWRMAYLQCDICWWQLSVDTVEITDEGQVLVNGNALIETNIFYPTTVYLGFTEYPVTLGPGECFVLADQRDGGADSRFFGPVKESEILGTVFTIMRRNNL